MTDVDGTISETTPEPDMACVSPACRHYLGILTHRLALVAAISGRRAATVKNMVNIDGMIYVGNHGMESWVNDHTEMVESLTDYPEIIKAVIRELTLRLKLKGITIEDKGITASIHYRQCPDTELAERTILSELKAIAQAGKLRTSRNKKTVELLPPLDFNKGTAVTELIRKYHLGAAVYMGDDVTDIDAFEAIHREAATPHFQGLAIGVTSKEMPARLIETADFTLSGVTDVARFLKWLCDNIPGPADS